VSVQQERTKNHSDKSSLNWSLNYTEKIVNNIDWSSYFVLSWQDSNSWPRGCEESILPLCWFQV